MKGSIHYTALETGWILMLYALYAAISMPISGRLIDKIGERPLDFVGLSVVFISLFILSGMSANISLCVIILCICSMRMEQPPVGTMRTQRR
ncbi:MFS transporter [Paenibacillus luteus]|uniref:MFS transporter n=1 Tax=Paenibacillus luteus TaxID=2545753 RepID=UPI0013760CF4|nr:MFS transporter [Paenibacillus luteus]